VWAQGTMYEMGTGSSNRIGHFMEHVPQQWTSQSSRLPDAPNTQGEVTSQNLWSRCDRNVVGITWHDVWS